MTPVQTAICPWCDGLMREMKNSLSVTIGTDLVEVEVYCLECEDCGETSMNSEQMREFERAVNKVRSDELFSDFGE